MKKLTFSIQINAPKERVWDILWADETYRAWTSVFHPGSYAQSDWKEDSKILFLGGDGSDGMISKIARLIPNVFMSFQHLGEMKNGVEAYDSPWEGAMENYTLQEKNGGTELNVELDADNSFADYFTQTFPKALDKVKELAEVEK